MLDVNDLRRNRQLVNKIDWEMTPEGAVKMFLEWGTGWSRRNELVAGPGDESVYFVLYDWEKEPAAVLVRRDMAGVEELARITVPGPLFEASCREAGHRPGGTVQPPNHALKEWLCKTIGGPPLDWKMAV